MNILLLCISQHHFLQNLLEKISLTSDFIIIHYSLLFIFIFFDVLSRVRGACEEEHEAEEASDAISNNHYEMFEELCSAVDGFECVRRTLIKVVAGANAAVVVEAVKK